MESAKSEFTSPKTAQMSGSLQPEFVRCGKPSCRCASGALHGPYWRRVYWQEGQRLRRYMPAAAVGAVTEAIASHRQQRDAVRAQRRAARQVGQELAAMRRLLNGLVTTDGG